MITGQSWKIYWNEYAKDSYLYGTEVYFHAKDNVEFKEFAKSLGVDLTWEEGPGMHNFDFWDPYIRRILDWLPIDGGLVD